MTPVGKQQSVLYVLVSANKNSALKRTLSGIEPTKFEPVSECRFVLTWPCSISFPLQHHPHFHQSASPDCPRNLAVPSIGSFSVHAPSGLAARMWCTNTSSTTTCDFCGRSYIEWTVSISRILNSLGPEIPCVSSWWDCILWRLLWIGHSGSACSVKGAE
jgi:hypothetical protein